MTDNLFRHPTQLSWFENEVSWCVDNSASGYQGIWVPGNLDKEGVLTIHSDKSNITIGK